MLVIGRVSALPPKFEKEIIGKVAKKDIESGTVTSWKLMNE
jgi:hypothetical protein